MKIASPEWLWLLAIIPLIGIWLWIDEKKRKALFETFIHPRLWPTLAPLSLPQNRKTKSWLWILGLLFACLSLIRPQWGSHEESSTVSGLDIMVVLDVSNSMEVEDLAPSRLKKAKHLLRSLSELLSGDRLGAVAFAGSAWVACPLTTDLEYFNEAVGLITPKMVVTQGTDIGLGLETAQRALERGGQESSTGAPDPSGLSSRIILLLSDGEDQEEKAVEAARKLKDAGIRLFVMGIGTQKGGPIPLRDDNGNLVSYKKDRKGSPIISTFKPDALVQLASIGDGKYWNVTPNEDELEEFLREIGGLNRADFVERKYLVFEERFQYPLAIAVFLLLMEMGIALRKKATPPLFLTFLCFLLPSFAHATIPIEAYIENEKGLKAFQEEKFDEAKKYFSEAQARDPDRAELEFNQGVLQMKDGNTDAAIQSFTNATKKANRPGVAGPAYFNRAAALSQKGDIPGAIQSYVDAIQEAKKTKDAQLEQDARKNIELLAQNQQKKKQEQKQDQKNDNSQQQKEQKQEQQQKETQEQKQDQKKEQDQKQASGYKQTGKEKFRSVKLKPEDAERVMAELKSKEQELQGKRRKPHGNPQGLQKDW